MVEIDRPAGVTLQEIEGFMVCLSGKGFSGQTITSALAALNITIVASPTHVVGQLQVELSAEELQKQIDEHLQSLVDQELPK